MRSYLYALLFKLAAFLLERVMEKVFESFEKPSDNKEVDDALDDVLNVLSEMNKKRKSGEKLSKDDIERIKKANSRLSSTFFS